MRKRFFFSSFLSTLSYCLLPLLVMSAVYLAITIPEQRKEEMRWKRPAPASYRIH